LTKVPAPINVTMLSRHLYRLEEVQLSLRLCLARKNIYESTFWALELIDSWHESILRDELERSWFYVIGLSCVDFLLDLAVAEDTDLLRFVWAACSFREKDSSVLYLLARGLSAKQPDTIAWSPRCTGDPVVDAIRQKKVLLAFMLLHEKDVLGLVKNEALQKVLRESQYTCEARAVAVLHACYGTGTRKPSYSEPSQITEAMKQWKETEGRRSRREISVRPEARLKETNLEEIRTPFIHLKGCSYWDAAADEMGGWDAILQNDSTKERFYELYFPDDIPDEWSTEAQEKSHRCSQVAEDQLQRQMRSLFSGSKALGLQGLLLTTIKETPIPESWESLYKTHTLDTREWKLKPVKKKLIRVGWDGVIHIDKKEAPSIKA
jgi:hypothetical protein